MIGATRGLRMLLFQSWFFSLLTTGLAPGELLPSSAGLRRREALMPPKALIPLGRLLIFDPDSLRMAGPSCKASSLSTKPSLPALFAAGELATLFPGIDGEEV